MPIFIKWIAKKDAKRRRMLQLRDFNHNHHLSRVKILEENIRRGISDRHILLNHSFFFISIQKEGYKWENQYYFAKSSLT